MDLSIYQISSNATISEALQKIEMNTKGFTLVTDKEACVVGILTDGDLRRLLLEGIQLNTSVSNYYNKSFVKARINTPRELLLKMLDHKIKSY